MQYDIYQHDHELDAMDVCCLVLMLIGFITVVYLSCSWVYGMIFGPSEVEHPASPVVTGAVEGEVVVRRLSSDVSAVYDYKEGKICYTAIVTRGAGIDCHDMTGASGEH